MRKSVSAGTLICVHVLCASLCVLQYAASFRSSITTEQQDFTSWMWEVALMLKLDPPNTNTTTKTDTDKNHQ